MVDVHLMSVKMKIDVIIQLQQFLVVAKVLNRTLFPLLVLHNTYQIKSIGHTNIMTQLF